MNVSAIYSGWVRHARRAPRHEFRQRVFLMYLDLGELDELFRDRWFWSVERTNVVSFRRKDYLGPSEVPLDEAVRDRVESELGFRPGGPIRMLTHLRNFGYIFNPVSFYYCHDSAGALEAVVAEITNTPWKERHAYVLDAREQTGHMKWQFDKDFHVSPFFDMDQQYTWAFTTPGEQLNVHMTNHEAGKNVFHASFEGERTPINGRSLAWTLLRHPFMTLRVHAAIYWQAALLYLKRAPFFAHPESGTNLGEVESASS